MFFIYLCQKINDAEFSYLEYGKATPLIRNFYTEESCPIEAD